MSKRTFSPILTLPRSWPCRVRSALLHVVALAQCKGPPTFAPIRNSRKLVHEQQLDRGARLPHPNEMAAQCNVNLAYLGR